MAVKPKRSIIRLKKAEPKQKVSAEELIELRAILSQSIDGIRQTKAEYDAVLPELKTLAAELRNYMNGRSVISNESA